MSKRGCPCHPEIVERRDAVFLRASSRALEPPQQLNDEQ